MTLTYFVTNLNMTSGRSAIIALITRFIDEHTDEYKDQDIRTFISQLPDESFTDFGGKLGYCKSFCLDETNKDANKQDQDYLNKLQSTAKLLNCVSQLYHENNSARRAAKAGTNESAALSQQKDVLREINRDIRSFKKDIDDSKAEMKRISESFNDKIFSVLINTVSLLGIFVTLAFAGFGIATIFSNINFEEAIKSEEAFVKNIFFVLMTSWLSYNLLLLLVYFIFKLSRPLSLFAKENEQQTLSFSQLFNLKPFLWIDGILALLTVLVLAVCLWIW